MNSSHDQNAAPRRRADSRSRESFDTTVSRAGTGLGREQVLDLIVRRPTAGKADVHAPVD